MLHAKLHAKFLLFILGGIVVLLTILAVVVIQRENRILTHISIEEQRILAQTIFANLKNNMIQGRPRSTLTLMQNMQGTHGLVRLEVLRRDGAPAFVKSGVRFTLPFLQQAVDTGEEVIFEEQGVEPLHTVLFPLKNDAMCKKCHAASERILGVILISLSRAEAVREIAESTRNLTTLLGAFILMIGGALYLLIRMLVLKPLALLHSGAELIGAGDLSHRIALHTGDELQGLADAFNEMAGRLEQSYSRLETMVRERTAQLYGAQAQAQASAMSLFSYSRDVAAISRLSSSVFTTDLSLDDLLGRFMAGITGELGYSRVRLCLVDRKSIRLKMARDTGMAEVLPDCDMPLSSNDPMAILAREGKQVLIPDITAAAPPGLVRKDATGPLSLVFFPLLSHAQQLCWKTNSCIKSDCPAYGKQSAPCWLVNNTRCHNAFVESYGDKLAYCMICQVFPVMGVLVVASDPAAHPLKGRNLDTLRILAVELGAALENHRLHDNNQQMVRELIELHRVTASALSGLSLDRALEAFAESALKLSGLDACNFWLLSEDGRELVRKAGGCTAAATNDDYCPARLPADRGLLGAAFAGNRLVVEYNVMMNDDTELAKSVAAHGLNSLLGIPLHTEGRTIGVFSVHKRGFVPFLETEVAVFMLIANQVAMAVNACSLNEELVNQNAELARSTNLTGGILASMSSGVALLDMEGRVKLINQQGARLFRRHPDELAGRRLADVFPETAGFMRADSGSYQELRLSLADGATMPLEFSSTYFLGIYGEPEGVIVVFRDLTELKALQAELLNKERFAAMGRVVAGVAHEIRNPLFGISAIGQIFERDLKDNAHRELSRALVSETRRLNQLVEELLIYGRPMKLNPVSCDMQQLWEDVISMHHGEIEKRGVTVTGDYAVRHPVMRLDVHQIRQVFLNLLRNSLDAIPDGGRITLRLLLDDCCLLFKITDTGAGIHAGNIGKVFDLFFTTKPKGTGLGLAICKKIVQDHGGDISIESEEGRGTTVTVKLPYSGPPEKREQAGEKYRESKLV